MRDLNQFACKLETVPGTEEGSFSAADIPIRMREGDLAEPTVETIETGEIQATSSSRPLSIGAFRLSAPISWILRPSGTPASIAPTCDLLLKAGMLRRGDVKSIAIGSITTGPFDHGETITGGTSLATGRVFRDCSATPLRYIPLTGTFQSGEVITGASSTATATSSAGPAAAGFVYEPADSDFVGGSDSKHHLSCEFLRGGYHWKGRGMLGELSWEFRNGQPVVVRSAMQGAWADEGDKALYSIAAYPDDGIAEPRFSNANLYLGAYKPTDLVDFNFSIPLGLEPREDANDAAEAGVRFTDYLRKSNPPIVTFEPAMVTAATYDFFGAMKAGDTFALRWQLGTKVFFYADQAQYASVGAASRRTLATVPLQIRLCGTNNDEFQIWFT